MNVNDACDDGNVANVIGPGRDATVVIAYGDPEFGDPVKVGRPVFVSLETGAGNSFSKTIISGRSRG